ncbi:MAG TPA: dihydrofolate reductase [Flavobacterium sp.]|uniref:dihydrofolate reductase n=1 Tax=Flavobacterium sp. TaxID=239 RepID=UPI002CDFD18F|nr:dihydrofolate reductase [Flavobacterium sp.]HSD13084.1 dihydrofolate reductase [Flavobacterium sp.]
MIVLIAAAAENNALGKDNDLLWHLPDDFKRFKQITTGHYIVMGRKTFESFPKPLPNRTHVIITRQENYKVPEGCILAGSLEEAVSVCPTNEDIFIIGGGEIYSQSMKIADKIELTRVFTTLEADTFFPEINSGEWKLTFEEFHPKDEKHAFDFSFQTYIRK